MLVIQVYFFQFLFSVCTCALELRDPRAITLVKLTVKAQPPPRSSFGEKVESSRARGTSAFNPTQSEMESSTVSQYEANNAKTPGSPSYYSYQTYCKSLALIAPLLPKKCPRFEVDKTASVQRL